MKKQINTMNLKTLETSKKGEKYVLRLFVAGINPKSKIAIENLRELCEEQYRREYEIEIIDIYQQPIFAKEGKIIAAPTLIKELPLPLEDLLVICQIKRKYYSVWILENPQKSDSNMVT